MKALKHAKTRFNRQIEEEMSLEEYLKRCKTDKSFYLNPAERLLKAIGEPRIIDTRKDPRLGRIFSNDKIRVYDAFEDFYGLENPIDDIVSFLRHASQGLEERKQILYLLGPVGGGKSSLAERLKKLMEQESFYAIKDSPIFESPLGLFTPEDADDLGVPERYLTTVPSPWLTKRLDELSGDITKLKVVKLNPSQLHQVGIAKTEPGDENNQDISSLVGKLDIRKLDEYSQNDPDAYSFSGGLCRGNRGVLEFVEMFKAPIKTLHPLLTATQESNYNGTEAISGIPFEGIVLAHSNESEWQSFRNNKSNEAFLDRICLVRVPYCLRVTEEMEIYKKLLRNSALKESNCAPYTLSSLAQFNILSRLAPVDDKLELSKAQVYDGKNLKDKAKNVKSIQEYKELAGIDEGFNGLSTRFAFKVLSKTFNFSPDECAADPVHLFRVLREQLRQEQFDDDTHARHEATLMQLKTRYLKLLEREIKKAYLESYQDYGQNIFDRYVDYAESWLDDTDYVDPTTGSLMSTARLETFLSEIEALSEIVNSKDFRNEVVKFCLKYRANNQGKNPKWTSYAKMREVIEKKIFSSTEELLPIISFSAKASTKDKKKHQEFVKRMCKNGYTEQQVRRVVEWYIAAKKT